MKTSGAWRLALLLAPCACSPSAPYVAPVLDAAPEVGAPPEAGAPDAGAVLPTGPIDRMGRPAINTALTFGDDTTKDLYNQEATYRDWASSHVYDRAFETNLERFDRLGGDQLDWPLQNGVHPLRDPLKLDVLIVDTAKDCNGANFYCEKGYLEIESELLLAGPAHQTCGGRTPNEDVVDKTLTLLVTKNRAPVSDQVNQPTKPALHVFPYLPPPN